MTPLLSTTPPSDGTHPPTFALDVLQPEIDSNSDPEDQDHSPTGNSFDDVDPPNAAADHFSTSPVKVSRVHKRR
jgi:hypothetical protein